MTPSAPPTTAASLTTALLAAALLTCLLAAASTSAMPAASSQQNHQVRLHGGLRQSKRNSEALNSVGEGGTSLLEGGAPLPGMSPAEAADVLSSLKSDKYRDFIQAYMRLVHKYAAAGGSIDGPNANFRF